MKAFVIKNKDGRYFEWFDSTTGRNHFSTKPIKFMTFNNERNAKRMKKFFGLKNCIVVLITIYEGDLEEENRVLKAKLETAEYWNRKYDGLLERVNDIKKAFRHLIKDHIEIINEINGFPLSAEKEEIDEYFDKCIQQALESKKDG